jgi:hypothetical protein
MYRVVRIPLSSGCYVDGNFACKHQFADPATIGVYSDGLCQLHALTRPSKPIFAGMQQLPAIWDPGQRFCQSLWTHVHLLLENGYSLDD